MAKQHNSKPQQQPQVNSTPKPIGHVEKGATIPRPTSQLNNNPKKK